jgi:hypothetical protein
MEPVPRDGWNAWRAFQVNYRRDAGRIGTETCLQVPDPRPVYDFGRSRVQRPPLAVWCSRYRVAHAIAVSSTLGSSSSTSLTDECAAELGQCGSHSGHRGSGRRLFRERRSQKDLEGEQSPGRIGRRNTGNGGSTLRTRRRSNALESTTPAVNAKRSGLGNGNGTKRGISWGRTAGRQRPR